ncbi:MAG: threonine aldolase family protein [Brevibacterium yomogidense]|uniref:Low-specificity L-threonine aldolase n=1 Tax=Brevibacterium yomogidense TaxID=946573 RepID=A0A1X6XFC6_9MICO|nr:MULTISPECIES: GntG family PLP-dependent aldolase [Brevibacterium]SLM97813.1 Low-specificity L-threonine aldolase [Brevibacterium yomogidense]SMX68475.1 L-threonine aldolase [Brevibacterium sp. Mu109]
MTHRPRPTIDLRSDTLTRPTPAMRTAMAEAEVGDDVYAEDPTINALEERLAEMFGHEAGLFCASGSLTNMLGVAVSVGRGQELLAESRAHVLRSEVGGHGAIAGVTSRTWISPDGTLSADDAIALAADARGYNQVGTALIAVENTHNFSGGRIADIDELRRLRGLTDARGIRMHMDGARVANAIVASGTSFADQGAVVDTMSVCLSKGLGAPVGSVLTGSVALIDEARYLRKRYGGGMRQAGILAAAGMYALDHHLDRLADDHAHAALIAQEVAAAVPAFVDPSTVETNIVLLRTGGAGVSADDFARAAADRGVRLIAMNADECRLVTHLDVSEQDARDTARILAELAEESANAA